MTKFGTALTITGLCLCAACGALFAPAAAQAQEPSPAQTQTAPASSDTAASSYEALIIKYVELNQALSDEERNWKETQAFMQREIEILEKEKALLVEQIDKMEKELAAEEEDRLGLLKKKETNSTQLDSYRQILAKAAQELRTWQKLLPESLSSDVCKPLFIRLGRMQNMTVPEQMELVCGLYREIENITNSAALKREIIQDSAGQKQEYNILYLGLAAAYALSDDGKRAAYAFPTKEDKGKWVWTWDNSLAKDISRAISLYKHETKADFVELPLQTMAPPEHTKQGESNA